MRTVNVGINELHGKVLWLGYVGENEHTQIVLDCTPVFSEYPAAVPAVTVQPPYAQPYPAIVSRDGNNVVWFITDSDLIHCGKGEMQVTFTENGVVVKSRIVNVSIGRSIEPTGVVPEPIENWLVEANTALNAIPQTINDALEGAKESGEFDGFSPTATVSKIGDTATISITDKEGTTTAQVKDGAKGDPGTPGQDGFSPIATVTKSDDTATISITDKNGTTTATVKDGKDGTPGQDGYSPTATVTKSGSVATISITDENGTTTATVTDGQDGDTGATPVISIGTVSTLTPGSDATASMDTTDPAHPVLSLGIPEGEPGNATIDDTSTANNRVWSAQKVNGLLGAVPSGKTLQGQVSDLKSAMDINIEFNTETDLEPGAFNVYGENSAQDQTYKEYRSKYIDVHNAYSVSIGIQFEQAHFIAGYCCAYDASKAAIPINGTQCRVGLFGTGREQTTGFGTFVLPPDAVYVRFFVRTFDAEYTLSIAGIIKPERYIDDLQAMSDAVDAKIAITNSNVAALNNYIDYISPSFELIDYDDLTPGYINGQGGINSPSATSQEKTSQIIPVNVEHTYKFVCDVPSATGTSWLAVGFWDANGTFLGRPSATVTTVDSISHAELTLLPKSNISYTNAAYMRVSWRTYGTQMATANDVTFEDKTLFETIYERQSGADKTYKINGGEIDVGRSGFNVFQLDFAPREESGKYTQGMAVSNGVIFQGYGDGSIDLIDLQTGTLINSYAANGGHCGSLSFSNVYPEGNTDFPLLYVASYNENKTFVYSITRTECTLMETYVIPRSVAGYCQETCIDKVTGILWCVGHKVNSYTSGGGLIVSAWDLSNATEEGGILTPTEIMHYDLPWVQYLQAIQVLNGQLFAVFGADGSTVGLQTHIMVSDLGMNIWKSEIADFPSTILSYEPEGLDFVYNNSTFKYDAILATRYSVHYYRLEF